MRDSQATYEFATKEEQLRRAFAVHVQANNREHTIQYARLLLDNFPSAKTYRYIGKVISTGEVLRLSLRPFRVALLSSFSIEFMQDALFSMGVANGFVIEFYLTGFDTFRQEIFDPNSGLYRQALDLAILAVEGEDWLPEIYCRYSPASPKLGNIKDKFKGDLTSLMTSFRGKSSLPILVHNFAQPSHYVLGIADSSNQQGQECLARQMNELLQEVCKQFSNCYVLNYDNLVSYAGQEQWYDRRMHHYAKFPLSQHAVGVLARAYMKYSRALLGLSKKCLVLDLDNTLWGGVIGEDGLEGIQLGSNYPGSAFVEFQQCILGLHSKGVILAIASKNNPQDVEEVFASHASMVLRRADFSAFEVHWNAKEESLRRIANKLNIGLDHIVFVDDNPAECEHIRLVLPMVTVIQLPTNPEQYSKALLKDGWFDTLSISEEDIRRSALYEQRAQAEALRETSNDLKGFYLDLDMTIHFSPVNAKNLSRASQLTQKTNQFNATTRRYSESDVIGRVKDPAWFLSAVSVTDRFGDNGIVGLMMAYKNEGEFYIDTFLLSCRVIGRTVETAMLAYLSREAATLGVNFIRGEIIPTPKNTPVRDLYERHGFTREIGGENDISIWRLECENAKIEFPLWIKHFDDKTNEQ